MRSLTAPPDCWESLFFMVTVLVTMAACITLFVFDDRRTQYDAQDLRERSLQGLVNKLKAETKVQRRNGQFYARVYGDVGDEFVDAVMKRLESEFQGVNVTTRMTLGWDVPAREWILDWGHGNVPERPYRKMA